VSDDGGETWTLTLAGYVGELAFIGDSIFAASSHVIPGTKPPAWRLRLFLSPSNCFCWRELPVPSGVSVPTASLVDARGRLILGTLNGICVVTFGRGVKPLGSSML